MFVSIPAYPARRFEDCFAGKIRHACTFCLLGLENLRPKRAHPCSRSRDPIKCRSHYPSGPSSSELKTATCYPHRRQRRHARQRARDQLGVARGYSIRGGQTFFASELDAGSRTARNPGRQFLVTPSSCRSSIPQAHRIAGTGLGDWTPTPYVWIHRPHQRTRPGGFRRRA